MKSLTEEVLVESDRTKSFGMAHLRVEGKPLHPDEIEYEHGEECKICWAKYQRQLKAYNEQVKKTSLSTS